MADAQKQGRERAEDDVEHLAQKADGTIGGNGYARDSRGAPAEGRGSTDRLTNDPGA